jgi:hypothetical protein
MNAGELTIELDAGPWEGEDYVNSWPVGGVITGRVRYAHHEEVEAGTARVDLRVHTEGRGDRDEQTGASVLLHEGGLSGGRGYEWPFELRVPPDGPISYSGRYINLIWNVRAVVHIRRAHSTTEQPVQILPNYDDETA